MSITLSPRPIGASPVDQPFLTVSLWTGLGNLTGRTFRFARESNDGFGEYVADTDPRAGPVTGTVVVNGVARDSSIIGSIDVRLIDGTRLVREFAARFRPSHTRCG